MADMDDLFETLFEGSGPPTAADEEAANDSFAAISISAQRQQDILSRRNRTNLVGLLNQGATCYLNSLLQTMFMTPPLRDGLLQLDIERDLRAVAPETLHEDPAPLDTRKIRVIPYEFQRLYSAMLCLDTSALSTLRLTSSFGPAFSSREQHDVQELNRLLFDALERSLVRTSQEKLIPDLYRGITVNQIKCRKCGFVSEREDAFYDLTLQVKGVPSVERSLAAFTQVEVLEGDNKYHCDKCDEKVDAEKGCKLRSLPPVLTLSLLRFEYDWNEDKRKKVTDQMTFPHSLDLSPYMDGNSTATEDDANKSPLLYDLLSVVIHSGGAYGGHYHCLIRDAEERGRWFDPKEAAAAKAEIEKPIRNASTELRTLNEKANKARRSRGAKAAGKSAIAPLRTRRKHDPIQPRRKEQASKPSVKSTSVQHKEQEEAKEKAEFLRGLVVSILEGSGSAPFPIEMVRFSLEAIIDCSWEASYSQLLGSFDSFLAHYCSHSVAVEGDGTVRLLSEDEISNTALQHSEGDRESNDEAVVDGRAESASTLSKQPEVNGDEKDNPPVEDAIAQLNLFEDVSDAAVASLSNDGPQVNASQYEGKEKRKQKNSSTRRGSKEGRPKSEFQKKKEAEAKQKREAELEKAFEGAGKWFDFNDASVYPVRASDLKKYYGGKECAYMLFYMRRDCREKCEANRKTSAASVPDEAVSKVKVNYGLVEELPPFAFGWRKALETEARTLLKRREEEERKRSRICVRAMDFGALPKRSSICSTVDVFDRSSFPGDAGVSLELDKRKGLSDALNETGDGKALWKRFGERGHWGLLKGPPSQSIISQLSVHSPLEEQQVNNGSILVWEVPNNVRECSGDPVRVTVYAPRLEGVGESFQSSNEEGLSAPLESIFLCSHNTVEDLRQASLSVIAGAQYRFVDESNGPHAENGSQDSANLILADRTTLQELQVCLVAESELWGVGSNVMQPSPLVSMADSWETEHKTGGQRESAQEKRMAKIGDGEGLIDENRRSDENMSSCDSLLLSDLVSSCSLSVAIAPTLLVIEEEAQRRRGMTTLCFNLLDKQRRTTTLVVEQSCSAVEPFALCVKRAARALIAMKASLEPAVAEQFDDSSFERVSVYRPFGDTCGEVILENVLFDDGEMKGERLLQTYPELGIREADVLYLRAADASAAVDATAVVPLKAKLRSASGEVLITESLAVRLDLVVADLISLCCTAFGSLARGVETEVKEGKWRLRRCDWDGSVIEGKGGLLSLLQNSSERSSSASVDGARLCDVGIVAGDSVVLERVRTGDAVFAERVYPLYFSHPNPPKRTYLTPSGLPAITKGNVMARPSDSLELLCDKVKRALSEASSIAEPVDSDDSVLTLWVITAFKPLHDGSKREIAVQSTKLLFQKFSSATCADVHLAPGKKILALWMKNSEWESYYPADGDALCLVLPVNAREQQLMSESIVTSYREELRAAGLESDQLKQCMLLRDRFSDILCKRKEAAASKGRQEGIAASDVVPEENGISPSEREGMLAAAQEELRQARVTVTSTAENLSSSFGSKGKVSEEDFCVEVVKKLGRSSMPRYYRLVTKDGKWQNVKDKSIHSGDVLVRLFDDDIAQHNDKGKLSLSLPINSLGAAVTSKLKDLKVLEEEVSYLQTQTTPSSASSTNGRWREQALNIAVETFDD